MPRREKRPPGSRIVFYEMRCDVSLEMEILLEEGKLAGTITEGDCSSSMIWFEGRPGPEMREFRSKMESVSRSERVPPGSPGIGRLIRKFGRLAGARRSLGR